MHCSYQVSFLESLNSNKTSTQVLRVCQGHVFSNPGHLHVQVIKELVKSQRILKLSFAIGEKLFQFIKPENDIDVLNYTRKKLN